MAPCSSELFKLVALTVFLRKPAPCLAACKTCKESSSGICALFVGEIPGHTEMPRSAAGWGSRGWASIFQPGYPVLCHHCPSILPSQRCAIDFLPAFAGVLNLQNLSLLPVFPGQAKEKKHDCGMCGVDLGTSVCTEGHSLGLSPPPLCFCDRGLLVASSCLVLANEGSVSRLSSPRESSPCFVTLLLHLEIISSYRAAMFSLGKGVERNGGASHLSSSSKPSLFPAPLFLTPL